MNAVISKSKGDATVDLWKIIDLFARHYRFLIVCALVGLSVGVFLIYERKPLYVSEAVLEVSEENKPHVDFERRDATDLNSSALLKTIEQTVASQGVLLAVLNKLELAKDPTFAPPREKPYTEAELLTLMGQRVEVGLQRGTRLIFVSAKSPDPLQAQEMARAVVDEFFAQKVAARQDDISSSHKFLLAEARRLEDEVHASEQRLQSYREKYNAVSLTDQHNIVLQRLTTLEQQVTAAKAQRLAQETSASQATNLMKAGPRELLKIREIASLPDVVELGKQIHPLAARVSMLALRYRAQHPTMLQATQELKELQDSMDRVLLSAGNAIITSYNAAKANEDALRNELTKQEALAMEMSRLAIDYRVLERESQSTNALYQQVLSRLKTSDLSQSLVAAGTLAGSRIRLVGAPLLPATPTMTSAKLLLALGLTGALGVGLAVVLIRHALDTSLPSIDDAEAFLGLPSLAVIPRTNLDLAVGEHFINAHPATLEAESFRSLRTALALLFPDDTLKGVVFTSALPGEGKSFCAANYAAALAQQGLRTLLIDADLRRAQLRACFALNPTVGAGLSDCLRDPSRWSEAVLPTKTKNLFVVGDLQGSVEGGELLPNGAISGLLQQAYENFDRVVIDTAPVTMIGDALYIVPHATAVCLVVQAGKTPRQAVRRACLMLGKPPTGLVLNQVRPSRKSGYYYYSDAAAPKAPAPVAAKG